MLRVQPGTAPATQNPNRKFMRISATATPIKTEEKLSRANGRSHKRTAGG
jgi:hypothetical protein